MGRQSVDDLKHELKSALKREIENEVKSDFILVLSSEILGNVYNVY